MPAPAPLIPPPKTPQTPQAIATALANLYGAPPGISKFGAYFFLQNWQYTDLEGVVGYANGIGTQCFTQYPGAANAQLFIQDLSNLNTGAPKLFSGKTSNYTIYIAVDRVSSNNAQGVILLPYQTAKLLSSSFMSGLATRLILDNYNKAWSAVGIDVSYPLPIGVAPPKNTPSVVPAAIGPLDWCQNYLIALSGKLTNPATWTGASTANNNADYFGCLSLLTDSSLQAVGIILGWLAGDAIAADPNASTYETAFWTLAKGVNQPGYPNYTTVEVGMMVGYTFSYLSGFISSERSKALIAGNAIPQPLTDPIKAPPEIFSYLSSNTNAGAAAIPSTLAVGNQLFLFILQEFYAIASDPTKSQQYQGFIQGFEQGLLLGADVMYQLLYFEAYYLGYTSGFRDGYTQGYSAGWTAGYGAGQASVGSTNWISSLSSIFGGLSQTLGSANTILSDAGYVVSVISSIL
jgi:hypothetical protein